MDGGVGESAEENEGKSGVGEHGTRVLVHSESVLQCHASGLDSQTRYIR